MQKDIAARSENTILLFLGRQKWREIFLIRDDALAGCRLHGGEIDIGFSIIIVITPGNAHPEKYLIGTGFRADVPELHSALVDINGAGREIVRKREIGITVAIEV